MDWISNKPLQSSLFWSDIWVQINVSQIGTVDLAGASFVFAIIHLIDDIRGPENRRWTSGLFSKLWTLIRFWREFHRLWLRWTSEFIIGRWSWYKITHFHFTPLPAITLFDHDLQIFQILLVIVYSTDFSLRLKFRGLRWIFLSNSKFLLVFVSLWLFFARLTVTYSTWVIHFTFYTVFVILSIACHWESPS